MDECFVDKYQQQDDSNYKTDQKEKGDPSDLTDSIEIGKTITSDKYSNTIDGFWFAIKPGIMVNPFDFVTIEHINHIKTIGMVQDLHTIVVSENNHHYFFDDTKRNKNKVDLTTDAAINTQSNNNNSQDDLIIARVVVMANSEVELDKGRINAPIAMPVGSGKSVKFANAEEVMFALGIPQMAYPIPAGIIEMSNALQVPVSLDLSYLVGPDTAHVNASGISGNAKTSYLLFLLQSIYQKLKEYGKEFALIIFNTKGADLLKIDKKEEQVNKEKKERFFDILDLDIEPFENVTYFLPRGKDGKPNSVYLPENSKTYSYELADVYDRLELLFSEIYDPHYNLSSIVNYIYEFWPIKNTSSNKGIAQANQESVNTWTDLFNFKGYPEEIITHKSSILYFQGHIQRFRKTSLFIDKKITSRYLGKEIKEISSGDIFVIDLAMLSSLEEQAFVIGDVMKSIDETYSSMAGIINENAECHDATSHDEIRTRKKKPKHILIFIDEVNRFLPKSKLSNGRMNAVAEQIMKAITAGRSRGTTLFSAQQFKSTVDDALHENTGLHIISKVGLSELSTTPYNIIDENTKMNITRLNKGELVMVHSAFRHPIKITFPKTSFKSP